MVGPNVAQGQMNGSPPQMPQTYEYQQYTQQPFQHIPAPVYTSQESPNQNSLGNITNASAVSSPENSSSASNSNSADASPIEKISLDFTPIAENFQLQCADTGIPASPDHQIPILSEIKTEISAPISPPGSYSAPSPSSPNQLQNFEKTEVQSESNESHQSSDYSDQSAQSAQFQQEVTAPHGVFDQVHLQGQPQLPLVEPDYIEQFNYYQNYYQAAHQHQTAYYQQSQYQHAATY